MKMIQVAGVVALVAGLFVAVADDVKPSKTGEWVALFDGKSLAQWQTGAGKPVTKGWVAEKDGTLHRVERSGDIFTKEIFDSFELEFEFKLSKGANSGVKYRFGDYGGKKIGAEYQVLDDAEHPDGKNGPDRHTAALYDVIPPNADRELKPVGEFNKGRVLVVGTHIHHYLNGKLVVDVDLDSEDWKKGHQNSKFKQAADFARNPGRVMLQDHGDEVWYRNIRIRSVTP